MPQDEAGLVDDIIYIEPQSSMWNIWKKVYIVTSSNVLQTTTVNCILIEPITN